MRKYYKNKSPLVYFVSGTQIAIDASGTTRKIEEISVGDNVLSLNTITNEICSSVVTSVQKGTTCAFSRIGFSDGTTAEFAPYHPLLSDEGWKSVYSDDRVHNTPLPCTLSVGDKLLTENGFKMIKFIDTKLSEPVAAYILEVSPNLGGDSNYIANGLVAY